MAAGVATVSAGFPTIAKDLGLSQPFQFAFLAFMVVAIAYLVVSLKKLNQAEGCAPIWERFRR